MVEGDRRSLKELEMRFNRLVGCSGVAEAADLECELELGVLGREPVNDGRATGLPSGRLVGRAPRVEPGVRFQAEFGGGGR